MKQGQGIVVLLNGTSSSGKTSISTELINQKEILFHHLAIDDFFNNYNDFVNNKLPDELPRQIDHQVVSQIVDDSILNMYYSTIKLFSEMGLNVVIDTVIDNDKRFNECLDVLSGQPTLFVGVLCSKEELARREQIRGDRNIGLAISQFDKVYSFNKYDLEVNTEKLNPTECAEKILSFIKCDLDKNGEKIMELNKYLEEHFKHLTLRSPLFYSWDVSLRFELGDPSMFEINKKHYMEQVYDRSLELFKALHDKEDEVLVVTHAYFADTPKNKVKKLNLYKKYIYKKEPIRALRLEIFPDIDCEPDEIPDPSNNVYRYWTHCRIEDLNYIQLIKAICNQDVGIKPMIYHQVYFINITQNTIFHIYDDRGCDVIASSREELMRVFEGFNDWILDYDRERMNKVFSG